MAGLPVEFRGHVTSVGVAKGAVTLPNLFAQVNGGRVPAGGSTGLSDPFEDGVIYPKPGRSRRPRYCESSTSMRTRLIALGLLQVGRAV